jgi:predicted outer membrane protein
MNNGSGMGSMTGMGDMGALMNARGAEFNRLWTTQMLTMHEAKLATLQTASTTLTDAALKAVVLKAIPIVRMHRDALSRMNTGGSTNQ